MVGRGRLDARGKRGSGRPPDSGLPAVWTTKICGGTEMTAPFWYHQSFVCRLRDAHPPQDIGIHGGLTHFLWTGPASVRDVARGNWPKAFGR